MNIPKKYDLEERLINFALLIIDIVEQLPSSRAGNHNSGSIAPFRYVACLKLW